MSTPVIAVVGRPNVGKSTIFNRIVGERISIVEDIAGVTRDRIYSEGEWLGHSFNIIDTGGIDITDEPFMSNIRMQAEIAMEEADVIIFLTSVKEGVTTTDEHIAKLLYRTNKPVLLAVNKVDNPELRSEIFDAAVKAFPEENDDEEDKDVIKFSFIGRPNVGKSSLVNAMLGEERVIVSNVAGTTRDAIDTTFEDEEGTIFKMIDTAGIRKKGRVFESTEKYSVLRALRAIERSDIVCVVLNAEEGIQEQDKKIAGYAHEAGKGVVILVNKWDTLEKDNSTYKEFEDKIRQEFLYLSYAPIIFVSAKTKQRLTKIPPILKEIHEVRSRRISSSVLNDVLMDAIAMNPTPTDKGNRLKIYYMTQVAIQPPTFVTFVNDVELMHFSYERFLENRIRSAFGFEGTPIHMITRQRK